MLEVKKLMPKILLTFRLRGATFEVRKACHCFRKIDMVSTVPTNRQKKVETSAPMEIGMAAKDDSEGSTEEGHQRIMGLALQAVHAGTGKGILGSGVGPSWNTQWHRCTSWRN